MDVPMGIYLAFLASEELLNFLNSGRADGLIYGFDLKTWNLLILALGTRVTGLRLYINTYDTAVVALHTKSLNCRDGRESEEMPNGRPPPLPKGKLYV
jgi:hypothetical protein